MININGKYFKKFTPKEVFTEYVFALMRQGKAFMVFPDNNQVLIEDEIDEWNKIHGVMSSTKRLIYHQFGNDGYVVRYSSAATNVLVPLEMLKWSYEDFIKQCEEDVCCRME